MKPCASSRGRGIYLINDVSPFHEYLIVNALRGGRRRIGRYLSNQNFKNIDVFPKRHRLVHNGGFPTFEALYCSLNMVSSTKVS